MAKINARALYTTCQMLVKQAEELSKAGKPIGRDILDPLEQAFNQILEFEKLYLIQCYDRFWGNLLMELEVGLDFNQRGPTDLKVTRDPMMLTINPMFCAQYTFPQLTGLIVQEMVKLVYLHPSKFANLNPGKDTQTHEMLEKASSASSASIVTSDIRLAKDSDDRYENGCRLPPKTYSVSTINAEHKIYAQEGESLEYYFKILNKFKDKSNPTASSSSASTKNGMSGGNPRGIATQNNKDGKQTHDWESSDEEQTKERIVITVSNAYKNLSEKHRGELSGNILSQINKLLEAPQINWKEVLRKMVGSIPVPYRKTKMRLNRRQPFRGDLSGQLPKRTVNIICCFDTSGSMTDRDIEYCMSEVLNILKIYEGYSVTLLECDYDVQRVYEVKNMGDVQSKVLGRGGTAFTPAIEYINGTGDFKNNKKYPKAGTYKNALMVYFTDGYGESSIPKPNTYRNLWVIMNDEKNLSVENPYGDVKSIRSDPDYSR